MIYSTEPKIFPEPKEYFECQSYRDENDFEWKIARVKNGFFVAYFGDSYFKDKHFILEVRGESITLLNTGCFFLETLDFNTFYEFRNILKTGFTDDIWESIGEFLTERLIQNDTIMDCEIHQPTNHPNR